MTDRPILFSPPMVRAILREIRHPGTGKTKTRRRTTSPLRVTVPGDRLWVREPCTTIEGKKLQVYDYEADDLHPPDLGDAPNVRERSALHMPRWASRITLPVIKVHTEPLQAITEDDARAEGVGSVAEFQALWDELHGPGSWAANAPVLVIAFRPVLGNIDAIKDPARKIEEQLEREFGS